MVECSQCLPEEMREGGNDGEMRLLCCSDGARVSSLSFSPTSPSLLMESTKRCEAVFGACKCNGTFSVMTSFQKPSQHVALLHLPLPARYPPSAVQQYVSCLRCCDKTGCLYVGDSHIRACVFQTGVAQTWLGGKETFICLGICHEDCGAFLSNLTETSFNAGKLRPHGDRSLWTHTCIKMSSL